MLICPEVPVQTSLLTRLLAILSFLLEGGKVDVRVVETTPGIVSITA